jgi:hypothetical protein
MESDSAALFFIDKEFAGSIELPEASFNAPGVGFKAFEFYPGFFATRKHDFEVCDVENSGFGEIDVVLDLLDSEFSCLLHKAQ